jgi:hypothetical protein
MNIKSCASSLAKVFHGQIFLFFTVKTSLKKDIKIKKAIMDFRELKWEIKFSHQEIILYFRIKIKVNY